MTDSKAALAAPAPVPDPLVVSLLERMTLPEKVGQMTQVPFEDERYQSGELSELAKHMALGSLLNVERLEHRNALQQVAVERSRLGIPLIFGRDVIHGFRTIFPIPLGQAASFNPALVEQAAAIAAKEAAISGVDWTFAPMLDIGRDPRWGRIAETSGEDPFLTAVLGASMVRGFQGSDPSASDRVAACAKHYVGYGAVEAGKDYNVTYIPIVLLRELHLRPFLASVRADVVSVMCAFNDLNGVPISANVPILRDLLKREWDYSGLVLSDWETLKEMVLHGNCTDEREAARLGVLAGVDMEMTSRCYQKHLPELVESGLVPMDLVDDAVTRILTLKRRLGLFERPYVEPTKTSVLFCDEHRAAAQELAQQSVVLLKNVGVLPLSNQLGTLALIGPFADDPMEQLGCWVFDAQEGDSQTLLSTLKQRSGNPTRLRYVRGLRDGLDTSTEGFAEAIAAARDSDVSVLCLGEPSNLSGECRSRAFLRLPGAQEALLQRLSETGKPIVLVIFAGRPLILGHCLPHAAAVLYAWHPGSLAGPAITNILFGEVAPSGKLPVSFPRAEGQIPIYYAHKRTGRPPLSDFKGISQGTPLTPKGMDCSYLDLEVSPEFPFGFGLSYTSFAYRDVRVTPERAPVGCELEISCCVENTGTCTAEAVVQLYVCDLVGSVTRPVRELKGFTRVRLAPGTTRDVHFRLNSDTLGFYGADERFVTEPGRFKIYVGGDSRASLEAEFELY